MEKHLKTVGVQVRKLIEEGLSRLRFDNPIEVRRFPAKKTPIKQE